MSTLLPALIVTGMALVLGPWLLALAVLVLLFGAVRLLWRPSWPLRWAHARLRALARDGTGPRHGRAGIVLEISICC